MIRKRSAAAAATVMTMSLALACGEPEWRESRKPVRTTDYGGSVQQDIAVQYDAPLRTIYDAPPELALRRDSLAQTGTPADSVRAATQQTTQLDTTAARRR